MADSPINSVVGVEDKGISSRGTFPLDGQPLLALPIGDSGDDGFLPVKERSSDQREALPGEPRCAVCGRYGEYICDQTDDDVCSLQCKQSVLTAAAIKTDRLPPLNNVIKLPAVDECFYVRDNNSGINFVRNNIGITVNGSSVPSPIISFSDCGLPETLVSNLESKGYLIPTPVQMQSVPAAIAGRNLIISASTGSGKTACFLVPVIRTCSSKRLNQRPSKSPLAIILAPTRELCIQIEEQAKLLGKGLIFKTALVVGGDPMPGQVYRIENGVELIIATPGRLIDLLSKHEIELNEVSILVLDEVDCMMQRGFSDQVMQIFRALSQPQVMLFSATISKEVEKMGKLFAEDMVVISVGEPSRPNLLVKQVVIWVETKQKKKKLFEILTSKQHFKPPVVVFVGSRLGADLLSEAIAATTGLKSLSIHGEKDMKERRETLMLFLRGEVSVLVSTGVLGRGVDLLKVRQVIIFDMPNSLDEYVHLVGRASRMGEEGSAIAFVNNEDKKLFKDLIQNLKSSGSAVPRELASLSYSVMVSGQKRRRKYGYGHP